MNVETELKFVIDPAQARALLDAQSVKRAAASEAKTRELVSTYFDSHRHNLRKAGTALRVRRSGETFEQTLKLPAAGPPGMQNYREWNAPLPGASPDLDLLPREVLEQLGSRGRKLRLQPVFTSEIHRTAVVLECGETRFEMALDSGRLYTHGTATREEPVGEVEFELLEGSPVPMLDFILELCAEVALEPLHMTKARRGYALARPTLRPRLCKARPVQLDADMSVGSAFQRIIGEALRHLQDNRQPLLEGQPGGVHQTRVAIRRVRAALRAFKKVLPREESKAFSDEFRWVQSHLSPARDWHVFLDETLPQAAQHVTGTAADLARLRRLALTERARATGEAQETIRSRRCTRLLLQFQRWVLALEEDQPALFSTPVKPFARRVLHKTRRDVLSDRRPLSRMAGEECHSLRKRCKKARYAMEFFSGLWEHSEVGRYLHLMEDLQDCLGRANDAVVARRLMGGLPPRALALAPASVQLVQDWSQARELQCNRDGQPAWHKLQRSRPFWK